MKTKPMVQQMGNAQLRGYLEGLERESAVLRLEGCTDQAEWAEAELAVAAQEVVRRIVRGKMSMLA